MPPPSVSPPTPVVETIPPVVASPCAAVASLKPPQVAPPPARAVRAAGSTSTPCMRDRSATIAPSPVPKPGTLCPPPRTARSRPVSRGVPHDRGHVGRVAHADDGRRTAVDHAVVDPPGLLVPVRPRRITGPVTRRVSASNAAACACACVMVTPRRTVVARTSGRGTRPEGTTVGAASAAGHGRRSLPRRPAGRRGCPRSGSNRHWDPFKGPASADWATGGRRRCLAAGLDRACSPVSRASSVARVRTASSIGSVSRPVKVFCWLTW